MNDCSAGRDKVVVVWDAEDFAKKKTIPVYEVALHMQTPQCHLQPFNLKKVMSSYPEYMIFFCREFLFNPCPATLIYMFLSRF